MVLEQIKIVLLAVIKWMLDPQVIVQTMTSLMGWVVSAIGDFLPGDVGVAFDDVGNKIASIRFGHIIVLFLYFMSPIVAPEILKAVIAIRMHIWFSTVCIRVVVLVKNHIWSAGR